MNSLYPEVYQIVIDKLAEFGAPIQVTRGVFTYDPVSGARTGSTQVFTYNGLRTTDFSRLISDFRIIGNASTMKIDIAIMFGGDVDLHDDDTMLIDGVQYSIIQIKKVAPAGLTILQYALGRI